MKNINLVEDVGAPLLVTAVNIGTRSLTGTVAGMPWADLAVYAMALGGYAGAYFGWGGTFVKNVGISAAPLAFEKLYNKFAVQSRVGSPVAMRRVARYPAPAEQQPFQGIKLVQA